MGKINFEGKTFFNIEIKLLRGGEPVTFPLFVHMKVNSAMVLRYSAGQSPSQNELDKYAKKGLQYFACPVEFEAAWIKYLEPKPVVAAAAVETTVAAAPPEATPEPLISDDTPPELVSATNDSTLPALADVLPLPPTPPTPQEVIEQLSAMSAEEKATKLQNMGQKMLAALMDITTGDRMQKWAALRECQDVTQYIVQVGLESYRNKSIYQDLVSMSGPDIEHSTAVATISTIFALICGYHDETELADISMSGLLHDVGLALVPPEIVNRPLYQMSERDFKLIKEHPLEGAQIIEEFGDDLSGLVRLAVFQHHERFDGSGYPKKLRGVQIDERVQIIHLADLFADYMRGKINGKELSPEEAFREIKSNQINRQEQYVSYEIFEPIQQVALRSRLSGDPVPVPKTGS